MAKKWSAVGSPRIYRGEPGPRKHLEVVQGPGQHKEENIDYHRQPRQYGRVGADACRVAVALDGDVPDEAAQLQRHELTMPRDALAELVEKGCRGE